MYSLEEVAAIIYPIKPAKVKNILNAWKLNEVIGLPSIEAAHSYLALTQRGVWRTKILAGKVVPADIKIQMELLLEDNFSIDSFYDRFQLIFPFNDCNETLAQILIAHFTYDKTNETYQIKETLPILRKIS